MDIKKSLLKKTARVLMKMKVSALFRIKRNGFYLKFYPSSVSRVLWVEQFLSREGYSESEQFFEHYLNRGDVVVDIGANVGSLTLLFSVLVGDEGKVYAIEPHPRIYKYLQGNIALNRATNIRTFNFALGNKNGITGFSDDKGDDRNSVIADYSGISVPLRRLDELEIEDGPIALLKIDVEGYEKFVIEGGERILQKVQCIYFESIASNFLKFRYKLDDLLSLLINQGFEILEARSNTVRTIAPKQYARTSGDLIAVRDIQAFLARTNFPLS